MAHAVVEWTDNLVENGFEIRPLLALIAEEMRNAGGVFPIGGIRVRGVKLSDYVIADDAGEDAFINITVTMGAGRSAEIKKQFFDSLFNALKTVLAPVFADRYLALSLYVEEADEAFSYKHNNIHQRFRNQ